MRIKCQGHVEQGTGRGLIQESLDPGLHRCRVRYVGGDAGCNGELVLVLLIRRDVLGDFGYIFSAFDSRPRVDVDARATGTSVEC